MTPPAISLRRRAARVLAGFFVVYALLVATHLGEFWPFSIYPMFSTAGQPWTRALVHELPDDVPEELVWRPAPLSELPGEVVSLANHGVYQNDLANYVSKTKEWTPERINGLQAMFRGRIERDERIMIYSVRGVLHDGDVVVTATPLMLLAGPETQLGPEYQSRGQVHE